MVFLVAGSLAQRNVLTLAKVLEALRLKVFFHSLFAPASLPKTSLSGSNNKEEKSIVDLLFTL